MGSKIWQVTDTLERRLEVTLVTYRVPVSIDVVPLVYPTRKLSEESTSQSNAVPDGFEMQGV